MKRKQSETKIQELTLSMTLQEEILRFIEQHPAKRFSKNLRAMLIEFLQYDAAVEASYLNDLLYDLEGLFDLLEAIESEDHIA